MIRNERSRVEEKGSAFFLVVFLAVVCTVLVGAFFSGGMGKVKHVKLHASEMRAFNAAESGLNTAIEDVWNFYRNSAPNQRVALLDPLDGKVAEADRFRITTGSLGDCTYSVFVRSVIVDGMDHANVEFVSEGRNRYAVRRLIAVVEYGQMPAEVFDHAYFINNFGWLWGSSITVNGSVRSNGNFSVKDATVNGDIYASENPDLGAAGTITGTINSKDISTYNSTYGDNARPTSPYRTPEDVNGNGVLDFGEDVNGNGTLDEFEDPDGYDGSPEYIAGTPHVDMPYIGDLSTYESVAVAKGGTISQGGTVLVNGVLGDGGGESENLLMVGTAANPIVIDGPVVIRNDVVLKGVITGQGTIYAGRNVHILDDLTYANPPSWPKNMTDRDAVAQANANADMVGLIAKGSVVLGDYTTSSWESSTGYYLKPPFTQSYVVDPTDASIGYVTGTNSDGDPTFNGNYLANDGGSKATAAGGLESRRFIDSSFADETVHALCTSSVERIDAIMYTNHLLAGRIGAAEINGTLVSRDEAIIYSGSLSINYDVRTRKGNYAFLDVYLPRDPMRRILYWDEGARP